VSDTFDRVRGLVELGDWRASDHGLQRVAEHAIIASDLVPEGEWRCLCLSRVREAQMRDGPWFAGEHRKTQRCVGDVDLDINVHVRRLRAS
jgi:hypothetical protein